MSDAREVSFAPVAIVSSGSGGVRPTAVLDASGFPHVAEYAYASSGTGVRYLMVGAPLWRSGFVPEPADFSGPW